MNVHNRAVKAAGLAATAMVGLPVAGVAQHPVAVAAGNNLVLTGF